MVRKNNINSIFWVLALIMYSAFFIGGHISYGYIFAYISVVAFLIAILVLGKFKLSIKIPQLHIYILSLAFYCLLSSLWAQNSSYAISRSIDLVWIFVLTSLTCLAFQNNNSVDSLLKLIMWEGFIVSIYGALFYGIKNIIYTIVSGLRVSNDAINANTLGMMAAYAILINVYYILREKRLPFYSLFSVVSFIMLVASGSRKAIVVIVAGVFLLLILNNLSSKRMLNALFKIGGTIVVFVLLLYIASKLPMFAGVYGRIQTLINSLTGNGAVDYSTVARSKLVEIGIDLFKSNPILGVGMDNAKIYGGIYFNKDEYYLHNNYIELLADGGIIGFLLYYSIFLYLLISLWKHRNFQDSEFIICFVLLLTRLILDFGMVSYDGRFTYLLILLLMMKNRLIKNEFKIKLQGARV